MHVRVKWIDGVSFVGESETGHAVVMDGAPENGGRNIGMRPMEMLLIGMGGCTSFDVVAILKKARQPIVDCVAEIDAERADEIPHMAKHRAVLFPLTNHLDLQRVLPRIKVRPQLHHRLRHALRGKQRMQIQERKRSDGSSSKKGAAGGHGENGRIDLRFTPQDR